mgnify:CR=1 FL=1
MTRDPEVHAAKLFDEYLQACLDGQRPDLEGYLSRCPQTQRAAFKAAADGIGFLQANYEPLLARPEVVGKAHARIGELAARRRRSAEASARRALEVTRHD